MLNEEILKQNFISIISKGAKSNTYKFALARFLLDFSLKFEPNFIKKKIENDENISVEYQDIAYSFLKYYWHQECRFRVRQNFDSEKPPSVISVIRDVFGEKYIPESFEKMPKEKKRQAQMEIKRRVFGKEKNKTSQVIPRFQNIRVGNASKRNQIFYDYDDEAAQLLIKPEALKFFHDNHTYLMKAVILEWSKFLEKINTLPRLIAKIEKDESKRSSIRKYVKIFNEFKSCFYCNTSLDETEIEVDHFIPWSYIFEDEAWNLVLACKKCNRKKSDSLTNLDFCNELIKRNMSNHEKIESLRISLMRLHADSNKWEKEIKHHYSTCKEYGFNIVSLP